MFHMVTLYTPESHKHILVCMPIVSGTTMCSDRHLRLMYEYLSYQFQAQDVSMASAAVVCTIIEEQGATPETNVAPAQ